MGVLRALVVAGILLPLLFASSAFAAPAAQVDASTKHLWLAPYLDVLEDETARLDLADMTSPDVAARFAPFGGRVGPNYAYTKSALWVRLALENTSDLPVERWLVVDAPFVENLEVFRDGEAPAIQGVLHPRAERELPRRSYSFRVLLGPHQTRVVHFRVWGEAEVMLPLELWEVGALGESDRESSAYAAFGLGVMLAMALYNAFLFLFVRQTAHLYYAGYVVAIGLWCMCLDGSLLETLPARVQVLPHWVNVLTVYSGFVLAGLFVRTLLALPVAHRRLDRGLLAVMALMVVLAAAYLCGAVDYRSENILGRPVLVGGALGWIAAAVIRWREGLSAGAYVLFGWTALFVISVVMQLSLFGVLPVHLRQIPMSFGFAVEAIILSLALADATRRRVKQVEERGREVGLLNDELRHQVAERSRELTEALARSEGTVAPASLDIGEVFDGRYRVLHPLGRGGMGAVHEVERIRDGRRFALKVVTAALSAKRAARFAREAEIGARLQHDHLVSIVDVGIAAGAAPFLVMELVRGGSLEDRRTRFGDVPWARPILRQVASGLAMLHASHVVHRDLKPGNVLIVEGKSGCVAKISDFGISRFGAPDDSADVDEQGDTLRAGGQREASPGDLTEPGALLGTLLYMPPEGLFGAVRHPSADIFSLGVLAYEALSGRSPFPTPPVLLVRARKPIPEPTGLDGVPHEVAKLVLACLTVEPSQRPSAKELAAGL